MNKYGVYENITTACIFNIGTLCKCVPGINLFIEQRIRAAGLTQGRV